MSVDDHIPELAFDGLFLIESGLDPCILARARRDEADRVRDFEYLDFNTSALTYLGREREELVGRCIRDLLPAEYAERLIGWLASAVQSQQATERIDIEFFNSGTKSSGRFDVRVVPVGEVVSYAFRDLTTQREQADRYRLLLENSSDVVIQTDIDGKILWASDAIRQVLGVVPCDLIGVSIDDLMHPEDVIARQDLRERMAKESRVRFRLRLRGSEGTYHHFDTLAQRWVDADGTMQGVIAGLHLIDEMVKTETAARTIEERYRLVADNGTDVIALERRGVIEWVSPYMERLMDLQADDVIGRALSELVHPDDRASLQTFYRGGEHPETLTLTLRMLLANGSYNWVSMRSHEVVDEMTGERVRVTAWSDAQKDVASQRALTASEGRFRLMAESATDVVIECDKHGNVRWLSPSALSTFGWRSEQVVGSTIDSLVFADDLTTLATQRRHLDSPQSPSPIEVRYVTSTGNVKWVLQHMRQVRGPSVEDGTVVIGLRDIDDVVRLRLEAKEAREEFRLLSESATDVVYRVNLEGELTWVSPSIVATLGWMAGDVLGHSVLDLVYPEDHPRVVAWRQLLHFGENLDELTIRVRRSSGDFLWMKARAQPSRGDDGRVNDVVVSLRSCEVEVVTARALRTISAGSRVLIRAENSRDLLEQMCQVAVEEGGYLLAWYGKKIDDERGTVKVLASSVGHESYLEDFEVNWREGSLGSGPTGRAMRSGRTSTIFDIDADKTFDPWREKAHRHGFRSVVAIPVTLNGRIDGTWQVYAMEPRAFTTDVLTVLEDMAMEIGFGLTRLGGSNF